MRDAAQVFTSVLRSRGLRRELFAFLIFNCSEWAVWVAILVYAYDHGGAAAAGTMAVIQLVPAIFVAPVGSIIGDKLPREKALALGYCAQAAAMGLTALALWSDAPLAWIYVCAALSNCTITLTRPVHYTLLPEIAETPPELMAANAASGFLEGVALLLGPLPAGVLLAHFGAWAVFTVATVAMFAAALLAIRLEPFADIVEQEGKREPLLSGALEGFRELHRERAAALLTVLVGASYIVIGMLDVLTVVLALGILRMNQAGPSLMTAALGVGGLLGAAATAVLVGRRRLVPALLVGVGFIGIPLALVALTNAPPAAAVLLVVAGGGQAFFGVAGRTLLQRTVDDQVLARVFGLQEAMLMAGLALGSALAPAIVKVFQPRGAFVAAGLFLPLVGLLVWPRLRKIDAAAEEPIAELALLRAIPMFRLLAPPGVEQLSRKLVPIEAKAGSEVIREGDPGDCLYVIVDGELAVTSAGRLLARVGRGSYVGEIALLRGVPRIATVTAVTDAKLLVLGQADFLGALTGSRPAADAAHSEIDRRMTQNLDSDPDDH